MRYVIAVLIVCTILAAAFQASSAAASADSTSGKAGVWSAGAPSSMEKKLLEALEKLNAASSSTAPAEDAASDGLSLNNSSLNSSMDLNSPALNSSLNLSSTNSSAINSSMIDASAGAASGSAASPAGLALVANDSQNLGSANKGGMKGFYGIEASSKGFGKNGVNSHMYLSGDFNIDNNVKFQDRDF
ncbi:MAG: hypothetical protein HPY61_05530 [Methanotrichaceae archaeon]|nr:hypothetical protein [Methanotrichaceae archaeon]